jgi:hypothetical protein
MTPNHVKAEIDRRNRYPAVTERLNQRERPSASTSIADAAARLTSSTTANPNRPVQATGTIWRRRYPRALNGLGVITAHEAMGGLLALGAVAGVIMVAHQLYRRRK